MTNIFEIDEPNKTIKTLNLDDFSIEDLKIYLIELKDEIDRVELEIQKKKKIKKDAENFFE